MPEFFDLRVKARSLAYLFAAGAGLGLLTLAVPHDPAIEELEVIVVVAIAAAIAVVGFAFADRLREWQLQLALAAGTLLLTFGNYYVGESTLYPLLYSWTALYAFSFFTLRVALAHVALLGVCYAALLAIQDPTSPAARWLLAVGAPLVIGLLVSRLLMRLGLEVQRTEEHQTALRQREARTRLVLDTSPDAFVTTDRDGIIVTWNRAAERMFGWSASEAIGTPMRALIIPPEFRDRTDRRHQAMIDTEGAVSTELFDAEYQRRDGSRFPGEATVAKVVVGEEVLVSGFLHDVSERRRRQEERDALLRAQAAQAEAERVTELVSGMQLLVDAALASRSLDDIVADLVARVRDVLDADAATIFLAEEDEQLRIGASSLGTAPDEVDPFPFGDGFAGRVAQRRQPLLAQSPDPADLGDPGMRALDVDSLIGVPLLADAEVTGVLVACASPPRRFTADDLSLLRLAADRVGLAISHARLYERERRIAETLQRSLLPENLPRLPGLGVAARYLPAQDDADVGGDWYDVIPIGGGSVGLVMGDIAGKGLEAASMVGRLRSALRAYALEGHDPAKVVDKLNRLVWTESERSQMATLLYVVVDPAEGVVRWVNAGHPPPLILDGDGAPRYLEGGSSVPLGVLPFPSFRERTAELAPGSTILLYTDGLVETPGAHIDDGMARLASLVRDGPEDPEALCDHIVGALVPAQGTSDDVALLGLRNVPMSDRFTVQLASAPEALSSMRSLLRRWLRHVGAGDQEIADITTACGEAATNAIEHAGPVGGRPFEVSGRLRGGEVQLAVRDFGAWRDPRDGDQGRGLSLMRALMDTVEVAPAPDGTTIWMRHQLREIGRQGGPE